MKFLIDENVNVTAVTALRSIYADHSFSTVSDQKWRGLPDVDLFKAMGDAQFSVIVTRDVRQLDDPTERAVLRDQGIHWVGLPSPKFGGLKGLALETAAVVAGLSYVLEGIGTETPPTAFRLHGVPSEAKQRVRIEPL
ncbi:MAG: hypothetical protein LBJ44_04845 [Propionibacteriaceae bacterium]|jgi:hypothetical protein|nr:hypothetical protein [Propionibacteriaceae bacterium]